MSGKLVLVRNFTQNTARIAHRNTVGGNIPRYHRACADNTACAHRYTTAENNSAANPAVVPDGDGTCAFEVGDTARLFIEKGVSILVTQRVNGG